MAYDHFLADRVKNILEEKGSSFEEKKMFGGLCYMVDGKMCIGVESEKLMARIGPDAYEAALQKPGCEEMNFTGRPLKGFVYILPEAIDTDQDLEYWVQLCLDFMPFAKASKKKKKK